MTIKKIKKFLNFISTTSLVSSPIIAMGGGLLSNNQSLNDTLNNEVNNNVITTDYTEIACDNWVRSTSGTNTLWTCNTANGDIVLFVTSSGRLTVDSGKDILKTDPETTNTTYNLNLSSITGVTSLDDSCFSFCYSIAQITFPNGITSLGESCFNWCSGLSQITLPNGITSLGQRCFFYSSISQITLPDGITSLGESCFEGCSKLLQITLPNSITSIGDSCFKYCSKLSQVTLPDGLTSLPQTLFYNCLSLPEITLPDSITSIGGACFYNCYSLLQITLPDGITSLGVDCFRLCKKLSQITLPDGITSIGETCFTWCESLSQITLPNSITSLGDFCFCECSSLSQITFPNSITSLGRGCFSVCPSLSRINILTENDSFTLADTAIDTETTTEVYFANEALYNKCSSPTTGTNDGWTNGVGWSTDTSIVFTKYYYSFTASEATKSIEWNGTATNLVLGSFKVDNLGIVSNAGFNAEFTNWNSSSGTSNSGITLNVVPDSSDSSGLTYNVVASWNSTQFTNLNETITFGIKVSNGDGIIVAATESSPAYNWTVTYADLSSITIKAEGGNEKETNDWKKDTEVPLTATANTGTSPEALNDATWDIVGETSGKDIYVDGSGSSATLIAKPILPQGEYNVTIKCTKDGITGELPFTITKEYVNFTSITVSTAEGEWKTTKDWNNPTTVTFNAAGNFGSNPDNFNGAHWELTGNTGNGKITMPETPSQGNQNTLSAAPDLAAGTYEVSIKCIANGITSNEITYTIDKQYIDYNKSNYEITGGIIASATANIEGTATTTLSVSAKSEPAGIESIEADRVDWNIKNVSCAQASGLTDNDIWVNDEKKLAWNPIEISTPTATVTFTIVATLLDHNNDTIEIAGQINVSSKYAKDVTIKENQTTVNETTIIAGKESRIDGVVQIADVKDDTNSTNWNCNYEGKYALSWDGQGDVDNYFALVNKSSEGKWKIQDLVCKNTLAPGSYNLSIIYQFKTNGDDSGLSGTSNRVSLTVNVVYDAPSSGDITISGDNALVGTVAEEGKSGKYKYNIANANKNDPDATISYRIEVSGDKYSGGIKLEDQKSDKSTIITWNDTLAQGTYTIQLYARYQSGTTNVESNTKTIKLNINYANVNGVAIEGNKKLDINSENKSSQFNIKPTSENGNINSIDPSYKDNSNYTWSISSTDENTMEAINNSWITINTSTGELTWTKDLDAGYSYQLTITATHTTQGSSLSATFTTTISSKKPINWAMIGGIVGGIILAIILSIISWIIIRNSKVNQTSKKHLS